MGKKSITVEGYAVLDKTVTREGSSGRVYVPRTWAGKRVSVVLLDPPDQENDGTEPSSPKSNPQSKHMYF
jgi:putative transposon-encoded protein